jgi:hypothetical protein
MQAVVKISVVLFIAVFTLPMLGQAPAKQPEPVAPSNPTVTPALSTQVKKTVVYLRADCLHDFTAEASSIGKEQLAHLPLPQEVSTVQQLVKIPASLKLIFVFDFDVSHNHLWTSIPAIL